MVDSRFFTSKVWVLNFVLTRYAAVDTCIGVLCIYVLTHTVFSEFRGRMAEKSS